MDEQPKRDRFRFAFLATVALPENACFGGLLITNYLGRPLEFQCTAPVQPNRTQALLYGPTLRPFVLTELIGRTLVEKASIRPDVVLVDDGELLPLREHVGMPVGWLRGQANDENGESASLGRHRIAWHAEFPQDRAATDVLRKHLPAEADLQEPFERVRAALQEAVGAARAA